jgi:hypothetical protein
MFSVLFYLHNLSISFYFILFIFKFLSIFICFFLPTFLLFVLTLQHARTHAQNYFLTCRVLPLQENIPLICTQEKIMKNEEKSILPLETKESILESFLNFKKSLRKLNFNGDSEQEEDEEEKITELDDNGEKINTDLFDKIKHISDEKRKVENKVESEEKEAEAEEEAEESSVASPAVQLILDILKRYFSFHPFLLFTFYLLFIFISLNFAVYTD